MVLNQRTIFLQRFMKVYLGRSPGEATRIKQFLVKLSCLYENFLNHFEKTKTYFAKTKFKKFI